MILDPEMRTLLKQLADNTGRLARAVEAVLDAENTAYAKTPEQEAALQEMASLDQEIDGGRFDALPPYFCTCQACEEARMAVMRAKQNT